MAFDFLVPVSEKVLAFSEFLPPQALGKSIYKHTEKKGLPVFANATVAILGVLESRNAFEKRPEKIGCQSGQLCRIEVIMQGQELPSFGSQ